VNVNGGLARDRPVNFPSVSLALWVRCGGLWVLLRVERRCVVRRRDRVISGLALLSFVRFVTDRGMLVGRPSMLAMWR